MKVLFRINCDTDDRLQTITLIGTPDLIKVAETYIKQLDLRQRQVALQSGFRCNDF